MVDGTEQDARLAHVYEHIAGDTDFEDLLGIVRDAYGLKHVTFQAAKIGGNPEIDPYVRTTYSADWVKRYLQRGYLSLDPVVREGFKRVLPFDWAEFAPETQQQVAFFMDAIAHGVGRSGFSIPVTDKSARRSCFILNCDRVGAEWETYKRGHLKEWIELANAVHKRAIPEVWGGEEERPRLAAREAECLTWIAHGKEVPDIAIILGLSEHTVRSYLKSARLKLNCGTLAQAVFKASGLGLLIKDV